MKVNRRKIIKHSLLFSAGIILTPFRVWPLINTNLIDEIRAHTKGLAVWWVGHNGWLIKSDDTLIGTDLPLETKARAVPSPVSARELAGELDISFVTHEHGDHFERETSRILLEEGNCKFVMPGSCLEAAKNEIHIPEDRIVVAKPRTEFDVGGVHVEAIRAIHGNRRYAVYYEANLQDCGYVITLGGKRFFQVGDSVLLEDQLFLEDIDVLFFSPTEHNTYIERSVILINTLEPDYIFPQHRDTFKVTPENRFWTNAYPYEVKLRLSKSLQERYHILEMGKKMDIV
jgi:L-ascorbate metabolism protein UlaG (beta-lactamase superfamily)